MNIQIDERQIAAAIGRGEVKVAQVLRWTASMQREVAIDQIRTMSAVDRGAVLSLLLDMTEALALRSQEECHD